MYVAVGYKGWIEVRRASVPLKVHKSVIPLKPTPRPYMTYDPNANGGFGGVVMRMKSGKTSVPIITITGGRVLHTIPKMRFYRSLDFYPRPGTFRKLSTAQYATLKAALI